MACHVTFTPGSTRERPASRHSPFIHAIEGHHPGITKRVYPHLLRHSVATTLLERGMPLEQIQQFLGHAKLETTQVYAASTTAMIKESYQKALTR